MLGKVINGRFAEFSRYDRGSGLLGTLYTDPYVQYTVQLFRAHGLLQGDGITARSRESIAQFVQDLGIQHHQSAHTKPVPLPYQRPDGSASRAFHRIAHRSTTGSAQLYEEEKITEGIFSRVPYVEEHVVLANGIGNVEREARLEGPAPRAFWNGHVGLENGGIEQPVNTVPTTATTPRSNRFTRRVVWEVHHRPGDRHCGVPHVSGGGFDLRLQVSAPSLVADPLAVLLDVDHAGV